VSATIIPHIGGDAMPSPARSCATCVSFRSDPIELESAIPGLRSFGSGFAAVRSNDGVCVRHDRYLSASACCTEHASRR